MTALPILQVVPQPPGTRDGVGDYALTLAKILRAHYARETAFVSSRNISDALSIQHEDMILHYVNYGYQKRGVPFALVRLLRELRRSKRGRLLTVFHELYALGSPWQSAFWLRPFQIHIARSISRISDICIASSETSARHLEQFTPNVRVLVHPVFSNFGEPSLSETQIAERDPHCWVICGGTSLIERSVRSFCAIAKKIPAAFSPEKLFVLGGSDNRTVRSQLSEISAIHSDYRPDIAAEEASQILSTCSFNWMDYFHREGVPTDALLKSSAFAAACAHGVITVLPNPSSRIAIGADALPGPYFVQSDGCEMPPEQDRHKVATQIYDWYRRHAASQHLAEGIAHALDLTQRQTA